MELLTCQVCFDDSEHVKFLQCVHRICPQCETAKDSSDACPVSSICSGKPVLDGRETKVILDEKRLELEIIDDQLLTAQLDHLKEDEDMNLPLEDEIEVLRQVKEPYPRMSIKTFMMGRHQSIEKRYPGTRRFLISETKSVTRVMIADIHQYQVFGFDRFGRQIESLCHGAWNGGDITPEQLAGARICFSNAGKDYLALTIPDSDVHYHISHTTYVTQKMGNKPGRPSKKPPKVAGAKSITLPNTSYPLMSSFREGQLVVDDFVVYCDSDFHDVDVCMDARKIAQRIKYLTSVVSTRRATMAKKLGEIEEQLCKERKNIESVIDSIETFVEYQGKLAGAAQHQLESVPSAPKSQFSSLILTRKYKETAEDIRQAGIFGNISREGPGWVAPVLQIYGGIPYCYPLCISNGIGYALLQLKDFDCIQFYNPETLVAEHRFEVREKKVENDPEFPTLRDCRTYVCGIQNGLPLLVFENDKPPEGAMIQLIDGTLFVEGCPIPLEEVEKRFSTDFDKREIIIYKRRGPRWSVHNRIPF